MLFASNSSLNVVKYNNKKSSQFVTSSLYQYEMSDIGNKCLHSNTSIWKYVGYTFPLG